jgi:hypothetical protein
VVVVVGGGGTHCAKGQGTARRRKNVSCWWVVHLLRRSLQHNSASSRLGCADNSLIAHQPLLLLLTELTGCECEQHVLQQTELLRPNQYTLSFPCCCCCCCCRCC